MVVVASVVVVLFLIGTFVLVELPGITNTPSAGASGRLEVRVTGRVPTQDLLQELGDAEIVEEEVRTVVSGRFADQAALHRHFVGWTFEKVAEGRRAPWPAS